MKRYTVVLPRAYEVKAGGSKTEQRTDFLRVGVAFPLKEQDGFSIDLYVPVLVAPGQSERLLLLSADDKNEREDKRNDNRRR